MAIPLIAGKKGADAAQGAGKGLLGDIYTRRWITPKKGKKPAVEHELKVNAASVGIAALAAGGAALAAGVALWMMQRKVTPKAGKDLVRIIDEIDTTYKTITVVDVAGHYETVNIAVPNKADSTVSYVPREVWVPAVTHEETVIDKRGYCQVRTKDGVPLWKAPYPWHSWYMLSRREKSQEYKKEEVLKEESIPDGTRIWVKFHTDKKTTLSTDAREGFLGAT